MKFRRKKKKMLDFDKLIPDRDKDFEKWLGEELIKEGNELLNNSPSKEEIIVRYLIQSRNFQEALSEIKKLEAQIQILKRD